jgi:hypothetical protein
MGGNRLQVCLEIDVCGLGIENPAPNIFLNSSSAPLNVAGRIVREMPGP